MPSPVVVTFTKLSKFRKRSAQNFTRTPTPSKPPAVFIHKQFDHEKITFCPARPFVVLGLPQRPRLYFGRPDHFRFQLRGVRWRLQCFV